LNRTATRQVGVLIETEDTCVRRIIESVCRYAQTAGWTLLIAPGDQQGRLRIPKVWNRDGVIVAFRNRSAVEHIKRLKLPVVDVSRTMRKEDWFVRVTTDDRVRAQFAVEHFRSRCIEHFACYAPSIGRYSGSSGGSVRRRFSRHDSRVQRDWCMSRDAGRLRKAEETQSSSAEVPLDKGYLGRQRLPANAVRQWCRRSSADFGSPRTIFHQIMGHWSHALKNLGPGVGARFRRMNPNSHIGVRVETEDTTGHP